jgi:flagellar motor switch protein FliM
MISIFKAVEWDNFGLVTVDSPMIYSIVDVLLGGRRGTVPMRIEGRPLHHDRGAAHRAADTPHPRRSGPGLRAITTVHFRFERTETNPRFAAIARPGNACVVFKLRIDLEDRGGAIEFLIPHATLEPARDLLLQMFMGEKFGRDSIWENHLAREIWLTDVDLEAVLEERTVSLGEVLSLQVGSVLRLNARPDSPVRLRCGEVPMLVGRVGRVGDRIVVKVDERIGRERENAVALDLAADLVLAGLLLLTTAWCALVYHRLRRLRTERGEMEAFIATLAAATSGRRPRRRACAGPSRRPTASCASRPRPRASARASWRALSTAGTGCSAAWRRPSCKARAPWPSRASRGSGPPSRRPPRPPGRARLANGVSPSIARTRGPRLRAGRDPLRAAAACRRTS